MKKIKVLHLGYSDNYGGASVAMNRINEALFLSKQIDSKIAIVTSPSKEASISLNDTFLDKIWAYARVRIAYKLVNFVQKTNNESGRSINFFSSSVCRRLAKIEFDILHLHWIGNETIRLEDLLKIKKPIVWTFHDKWALLGAEHTELEVSKRFVEGYSNSNRPKSTKGIDIDKWTWKRKEKVFRNIKIRPIVVSSWLFDEAKKSFLWKNSMPQIIHNPITVNSWELINQEDCKTIFDIPVNNKVIVFGAVDGFTDKLKGYANLEKALLDLSKVIKNENFTLLIFGDSSIKEVNLSNNVKLKSVGKISDFKLLNKIYCAANLVVVPSYFETFGQIAVESISCGVPVIAFRTSGLIDIIIDNFNGLLCEPFSVKDMSEKILLALSSNWDSEAMRNNIEERFGYITIAQKYESFYKEIMK
jgi:glycosyltransferase involved in cell wall biosynthesis